MRYKRIKLVICIIVCLFCFNSKADNNNYGILIYEIIYNNPSPSYESELSYLIWNQLFQRFDTKFHVVVRLKHYKQVDKCKNKKNVKQEVDKLMKFFSNQGIITDSIRITYEEPDSFNEFNSIHIYAG